ncbi:hypothetical protein AB0H83_25355 [Dactylosporangium sp. NPDC050688]|uniref:hypothetical protein n=1 Tax=Dactylosporangium sp. NPDC050688 TaxID=3157217 RepID=UPI0033FC541C
MGPDRLGSHRPCEPRRQRRLPRRNADAVIDLHDRTWPVIRDLNPWLVPGDVWYRTESQAFFAARAATWDTKFGDDLPAYAAAAEAALPSGSTVLDLGCGTGRALRDAIGPTGMLFGADLTRRCSTPPATAPAPATPPSMLVDAPALRRPARTAAGTARRRRHAGRARRGG